LVLGLFPIQMCRDLQRTACPYKGCIYLDTPKPWTVHCPTYREWVRQSEEHGLTLPPYSHTRCPASFTPEPYPRWGNLEVATDYCEFHKQMVFPRLFRHQWIPQDKCEVKRTIDSFVARFTGGPLANEDLEQDIWGEGPRGTDFPRVGFQTTGKSQDESNYSSDEPPISPRTV
ncbi:hypothetical protein QBC36DRAFT_157392, partial [Triangularia setosa]